MYLYLGSLRGSNTATMKAVQQELKNLYDIDPTPPQKAKKNNRRSHRRPRKATAYSKSTHLPPGIHLAINTIGPKISSQPKPKIVAYLTKGSKAPQEKPGTTASPSISSISYRRTLTRPVHLLSLILTCRIQPDAPGDDAHATMTTPRLNVQQAARTVTF